jgi:hypothetical protein
MAVIFLLLAERHCEGTGELACSDVLTHKPSFMKIFTGVAGILRLYLSNMTGCSLDVTKGKDL